MSKEPSDILAAAEARGAQMNLPYAGAVTPPEAHALHNAGTAQLVDVRTAPELAYVGSVPNAVALEWQSYPAMEVNPAFIETLKKEVSADKPVLFLCRSGVRSHYAATVAAENGYQAFNVLEGFEGEMDSEGHRNTVNGWRAHKLPWIQT